jgi:hypothetical protein
MNESRETMSEFTNSSFFHPCRDLFMRLRSKVFCLNYGRAEASKKACSYIILSLSLELAGDGHFTLSINFLNVD